MKNWLTYTLAALLVIPALTACEKDETKVTVASSAPLVLTTSATSAVLVQVNGAQTAFTANWNAVTFAISAPEQTASPAPTYQVQFAKTADGFGFPGSISAGSSTSIDIKIAELNVALATLGYAPNVPAPVYVRVVAQLGSDTHTFASEPVVLTITPYKECLPPNSDSWALVGPAGNGWPSGTPATENGITLTWDCDQKAYVTRTALTVGEFKFRLDKKWDTNLGGPATANLNQPVALTPGGPNLMIQTAGMYTVKLTVTGAGAATTAGMVTVTP